MKPGSKLIKLIILFFISSIYSSNADEKILSTPLLNIDKIEPSFEDSDEKNENNLNSKQIKEKKKKKVYQLHTQCL